MNTDRENRKGDTNVVLKKWVEYILLTIQLMLILILCAESNNFTIFLISKLIALVIFFVNHLILVKYTRLCE